MPCFGALAGNLPLRLGGSALSGWTAAQHARVCADLVAINRTLPLATWTFTKTGGTVTVTDYVGRQGSGLAHKPTFAVDGGTGVADFRWEPRGFADPYDSSKLRPIAVRAAQVSVHGASAGTGSAQFRHFGDSGQYAEVTARTFVGGVAANATATVRIWGDIGGQHSRAIGDYAGDSDKHDSPTEGHAPYAEFILSELQSQRGTAYTKEQDTFVDVENVALARFLSATGPRLAEKFRANAVPGRSDERLAYWERFLAVPKRLGEPKWRTRQKLAAHYRLTDGPTVHSVRTALEELLGDAFVDLTWAQGTDLASPPAQTFWPTINPGDSSLSLGGGAWTSERCTLLVEVTQPAGMSDSEFLTLVNVDLFLMLNRLMPAWATFNWYLTDDSGGGFFLDVSRLDFTALT